MELARTARFKRAYRALSPQQRELARKAIENLVARGFRYPALHVKRIKGTANIWEARVGRSCRMTFQLDGETLILRNIGEHDATLKRP